MTRCIQIATFFLPFGSYFILASDIQTEPPSPPLATPNEDAAKLLDKTTNIFQRHMQQARKEAEEVLAARGLLENDLKEALLTSATDTALAKEKMVVDTHSFHYADRHVRRVQRLVGDEDCMSREFDFEDPNFSYAEATYVLDKCRLLVLRNVHSPEAIAYFKSKHARYLNDLQESHEIEDMDKRVLYDEIISRYEILVPKDQYSKDIAENPKILKLLKHPRLLDGSVFVHSYGTSVTEPGTPHQDWHEEDNYLFNSFDSFKYSGIGGHDLPPYTINMFTPLLDLTYDHGPTEFCLGSSHLTGMYATFDVEEQRIRQNAHRALFAKDLLDDAADFAALWSFGIDTLSQNGKARCPPQFLRSALLSVGDVVLFDYQILHRAGHNLSNETRVQLYIAYARNWFRDLNYHVNTEGSEDEEDRAYSTHTRFASSIGKTWADGTQYTQETFNTNEPDFVELEAMRNIFPTRQSKRKSMKKKKVVELVVSAIDLDVGTFISVEGERVATLSDVFAEIELVIHAGSRLTVHSPDGEPLKTWEVLRGMHQLMVNKAILGIEGGAPEGKDGGSSCIGSGAPTCSTTA